MSVDHNGGFLTKWDPDEKRPFPLESGSMDEDRGSDVSAAAAPISPQQQRYVLNDLIGRLHRAIEAGAEYAVFEREEQPIEPFTPTASKGRRNTGELAPPMVDSAAAVLALQYEAIGRREVALLEADTRLNLLHLYQRLKDRVALPTTVGKRYLLAIENLESATRQRMEELRGTCLLACERELDRTVGTLREGQNAQQLQQLFHGEARGRHRLELESAAVFTNTVLSEFKEARLNLVPKPKVEIQGPNFQKDPRSPAASQVIYAYSEYPKVFGWLFKSTGIHASWQRRYITFHDGTLRYLTVEDPTRCVVEGTALLNIANVVRVELDTYGDSSQCVRPPPAAKAYQQHGFYIDCFGEKGQPKKRFRFCCDLKTDLTLWMSELRRAVDIYYVKATIAEKNASGSKPLPAWFDGDKAPPYRTRVALEDYYGGAAGTPRPLSPKRSVSPSYVLRMPPV